MAFVRVDLTAAEQHEDDLLPRRTPAPRPDPRIEAGKVASAIGDVIASEPRGVSRRGFLQGMGAASTVASPADTC